MSNKGAEATSPPDSVFVDDDGVPWTASDHPAVLREREGNPIDMEDGSEGRPRLVHLSPGFVLEDVEGDPASLFPVLCRPDHYERSMQLAHLVTQRRANSLLRTLVGVLTGDPAQSAGVPVAPLLPRPPELRRVCAEANVTARHPNISFVQCPDVLPAADAGGPVATAPSAATRSHWLTTQEAADTLGVNRKTLDRLARAHLHVPGGPVVVGGRKRVHLRWPATGLDAWLAAVRARAVAAPPNSATRPPRPRRPQPTDDGPTDWAQVRRRLLQP